MWFLRYFYLDHNDEGTFGSWMEGAIPWNLILAWLLLGPNAFVGFFLLFFGFPVFVPYYIWSWYTFANPVESQYYTSFMWWEN